MEQRAVLTFIRVLILFPFAIPALSAQQIAGELLFLASCNLTNHFITQADILINTFFRNPLSLSERMVIKK